MHYFSDLFDKEL